MPSTYSQNLRIELIASGEQGNSWGNTTNNNLGTLIEQAISGFTSLATGWSSNACTMTALNGANDQSRNMYLEIPSSVSLSAEGQLVAPTVAKVYVIKNNSSGGFAVRIKTGSSATTCLIPNGQTKMVVCNGTEFSEAVTAAAYFSLANAPSTSLHATNKSYVDTADALRLLRDGTQNMTGELILSSGGTPSNSLAAVSKQYVTGTYLPLAGGTLTGALILPNAVPTTSLTAVPKQYVDAFSINATAPLTSAGTAGTGIFMGVTTATASALGVVKGGGNVSIAGDGTLSVTGIGAGTVTNVSSGTVGVISVANSTSTPVISISLASVSTNGYLSATDWDTFNKKVSTSTLSNYVTNSALSSTLSGYATTSSLGNYVAKSGSTMTGNLNMSSTFTTNQTVLGVFTEGSGNYFPGIAAYRNATGSNYAPFVIVQTNNSGTVVKYNLTQAGAHLFNGDLSVAGNLSATGTKPFCIDHPVVPETKLYHVAVESPRNDLLYRGTIALVNGQAIVDIDSASRLTEGTFTALTQNAEVVGLHNKSGFGAVRASEIENGQFIIYAEDPLSTDTITWAVMAERNDANMHGNPLCDEDGRLVPEQPIQPE